MPLPGALYLLGVLRLLCLYGSSCRGVHQAARAAYHRRRARAFRAFTVKAHFIVHSNCIGQSEAKRKKRGIKKGKMEKRKKQKKTRPIRPTMRPRDDGILK